MEAVETCEEFHVALSRFAALAPHVSDELKDRLVARVVELMHRTDSKNALIHPVFSLVEQLEPYLLGTRRCDVASTALARIKGFGDAGLPLYMTWARLPMAQLAQLLDQGDFREVVKAALSAAQEQGRGLGAARVYQVLGPYLDESERAISLERARASEDENEVSLVQLTLGDVTTTIRDTALKHLLAEHPLELEEGVALLAPGMGRDEVLAMIERSTRMEKIWNSFQILQALDARLEGDLVIAALDAARLWNEHGYRGRLIAMLADRLPEASVAPVLDEAVALEDEGGRRVALGSLAPRLDSEQCAEALSTRRPPAAEAAYVRALGRTARYSTAGAKRNALNARALAAAQQIRIPMRRAEALSACASSLPKDSLPRILIDSRSLPPPGRRNVLRALALRGDASLAGNVLDDIVAVSTDNMVDGVVQVSWEKHPIVGFCRTTPDALIPRAAEEALTFIKSTSENEVNDGVSAVEILAPRLDSSFLDRVIHLASDFPRKADYGSARTRLLTSVAPYVEGDLLDDLVIATTLTDDLSSRVRVVSAVPELHAEEAPAFLENGVQAMSKAPDAPIVLLKAIRALPTPIPVPSWVRDLAFDKRYFQLLPRLFEPLLSLTNDENDRARLIQRAIALGLAIEVSNIPIVERDDLLAVAVAYASPGQLLEIVEDLLRAERTLDTVLRLEVMLKYVPGEQDRIVAAAQRGIAEELLRRTGSDIEVVLAFLSTSVIRPPFLSGEAVLQIASSIHDVFEEWSWT